MKSKMNLLFFLSACLDLLFSRGDELLQEYPDYWVWYVFDYAGLYRIVCIVLLLLFLLYRQYKGVKTEISKWGLLLYAGYWLLYSLPYYAWWIMVDQYNKRF